MQGRKVSAIVLLLLVGTSFALGSVLGQSGGWLGPGQGGPEGPATPGGGGPPPGVTRLVVQAEEDVTPSDWNATALGRTPPDSLFTPINSLSLTLTLEGTRLRPEILSTNASGLATFLVSSGSYALHASTPTFRFDIFANVTKGETTLVVVKIFPSFSPVDAYVLAGQDAAVEPVPTSVMYTLVTTVLPSGPPLSFSPGQFVQVVDSLNMTQVTSKNQFVTVLLPGVDYALNGTVLGTYQGERGEWVVLSLAPPPAQLPMQNLLIMTYSVAFTVSQNGY